MVNDGRGEASDDNQWKELNRRLAVLPIFSAECERGFSCMNATHIPLSNALDVIALRELMFVKLNGPPVP